MLPEPNCPAAVMVKKHPNGRLCVLQHMLQLTDTQKATLCALRRAYITHVTGVARQRQQLLQQLQHIPAVKLDHAELEATCDTEEAIMHKLQNCVIQENYWYLDLLGHVGHEVRLAPYHMCCKPLPCLTWACWTVAHTPMHEACMQ